MSLLGYLETFVKGVSRGGESHGFFAEQDRVKHDSVTDDVNLTALEDAGGYRAEHIFLAFEFKGVTGVGAALESGYYIITGCKDIDYFALAFVAPL